MTEMFGPHTKVLLNVAQRIADGTADFRVKKGPGSGNRATNQFMKTLRKAAREEFGGDFAEQNISGDNGLAVDYYFPDESTIIEIALGLEKSNSEFEKDILKAVIAKQNGSHVDRLVFVVKPGGKRKCKQPGRMAMISWAKEIHGITIDVQELIACSPGSAQGSCLCQPSIAAILLEIGFRHCCKAAKYIVGRWFPNAVEPRSYCSISRYERLF